MEREPEVLANYRVQITEYLKARGDQKNVPITTDTIDKIRRYPIPSPGKRINKIMLLINEMALGTTQDIPLVPEGDDPALYKILKRVALANFVDLVAYLNSLKSRGSVGATYGVGFADASLTVDGLMYIDDLARQRNESSTRFVAMWFSQVMTEAYVTAIAPAISACDYEPVRIDKKQHNNKIDDEIVAEIRRCKFLIADFSHGADGARGGVCYEAGLAAGLGIPVIFCVRESELPTVRFDTRQFSHIVWTSTEELKTALINRIQATIT